MRVLAMRVALAALLTGCVSPSAAIAPDPETVQISIRDAERGYGLSSVVELAEVDAIPQPTHEALSRALETARERGALRRYSGTQLEIPLAGPTVTRIVHDGYHPLLTVIEAGSRTQGWTLWLRPLDPIPVVEAAGLVHGHIIDAITLHPVADAQVHLAFDGASTRSDDAGYFRLHAQRIGNEESPLIRDRLVVRAADGRGMERELAIAIGADLQLILDLESRTPGSMQAGHRHLMTGPDSIQRPPDHLEIGQRVALGPDVQKRGDAPPASIRVGFGNAGCSSTCCTASCNHVCVFDLETYVRRGLNDEWIASWNTQALRAGAIAYRSYGAWHAFNPVAGRPFDLCSSACCQVNDPDTSSSTNLAGERTAGLMLIRNGDVFRSEYSAENNCLLGDSSCANIDLSCGNGFAGSPAANWPCLADPVGLNRDCFGHGRGMSQWGSQRWSLAPHHQSWRWQLDHYYNAHDSGSGLRTATISQVLELHDIRPRQRTVAVGDLVWIDYAVTNLAASMHEHVMLGASLRLLPYPFVDDPDNDLKVPLAAGPGIHTRPFHVPNTQTPGRYDLYGSLYIDVDENDAINVGDLAQALIIESQAIRVVAKDDLIFYDGYQ